MNFTDFFCFYSIIDDQLMVNDLSKNILSENIFNINAKKCDKT